MSYNFKSISSSILNNLTRIFMVLVIIYILFSLGKSIFTNYKINEKIANENQQVSDLQTENLFLKNQNLYYQTDIFKELEARRKLGLKKEGETVVIAPENKGLDTNQTNGGSSNQETSGSIQSKTSNYLKWWWYMMGQSN